MQHRREIRPGNRIAFFVDLLAVAALDSVARFAADSVVAVLVVDLAAALDSVVAAVPDSAVPGFARFAVGFAAVQAYASP